MRKKVVELFAGVGGFSLALRHIHDCETTIFCDIDQRSQNVLKQRQQDGQLPASAAVVGDVADVHLKPGDCHILCAGVPCTGFSRLGKQDGIQNKQSRLFSHVFRLMDECRPEMVFLENVRSITQFPEFRDLMTQMHDLGYWVAWTCMKASDIDGPHRRSRWFAVGVRNDIEHLCLNSSGYTLYNWKEGPVQAMVPRDTPHVRDRLFLLGNAMVPDCAFVAFMYLYTGALMSASQIIGSTKWLLKKPVPLLDKPVKCLHHGMIGDDGCIKEIPPIDFTGVPITPRQYTFDPTVYVSDKPKKITHGNAVPVTQPIQKPLLNTPRTLSIPSRYLSMRSINDLPTQIRFEKNTKDRHYDYPSPEFVEWMMGLPVGWTDYGTNDAKFVSNISCAPSCG
jgi:hypothetical protein